MCLHEHDTCLKKSDGEGVEGKSDGEGVEGKNDGEGVEERMVRV